MEKKLQDYFDNYETIAEFAVAFCKNGKIMQKLSRDPQKRAIQKEKIQKFIEKNRALGVEVAEEYVTISNVSVYPAFLEYYWNNLSNEEREKAIKIALKEHCHKEFDEVRSFPPDQNGDIYPFYIEDDKIYLNSDILESDLPPAHILGMLFAIPFEQRKLRYMNTPMPKNILGFENFEHLGCMFHFTDINMENDEETAKQKMENLYLDSVTSRAYRIAQYEALTILLEEMKGLSYFTASEFKFLNEEVEQLMMIDDTIDQTLESAPEDRDMTFIAKCNESLNQKAIEEGRTEDVVDEADALEHFDYFFEVDHVVDGTAEQEDDKEDEFEDDGPHYMA